MPDVSVSELQRLSQSTYSCDWPAGLRKATGINSDPSGIIDTTFPTSSEVNANRDFLTNVLSQHALLLSGNSGSFISTPDVAALDITGSIDLRIELQSVDFANALGNVGLIAKWGAAGQRSWQWTSLGVFNQSTLSHSANGTASVGPTGQTGFSLVSARRVTLDSTNGTKAVFTAPDITSSWTQIDSDAGAATSIFNSTAALVLGSSASAGDVDLFKGRITRAEVRNGIDGTVVANPDFRNLAPGTTSFTDGAGRVWTLQGDAQIV